MKVITNTERVENLKEKEKNSSPIVKRIYKALLENSAKDYIHQMSSLFDRGQYGKQQEYWKWQAEVVRPVKCVSYKEIPGLRDKVEKFLESNELIIKECYYNSMKVVWDIPGTKYVEGIANLIIPIDHAWNYYNGYYFDLTAELVLEKNVKRFDYAQVILLDQRQMSKYASKTGMAGGYIAEYYKEFIEK